MLSYCYWPLAVGLMALGQGLLLPAIRRTPPGSEARRQALALHYVLVASYYLPIALDCVTPLNAIVTAIASRLLFFDLVLNLASGQRPFYVGSTALGDKLLQRVASFVKQPAERVRFAGWVGCLVLAVGWVIACAP